MPEHPSRNDETSENNQIVEKEQNIPHGLRGFDFQLNSFMFFLYKALSLGYKFKMGLEIDEAQKFDDIVYQYVDGSNKTNFILFQTKYKKKQDIDISDIINDRDSDFGYIKYFNSYRSSKTHEIFENGNIKYIIINTNTKLKNHDKYMEIVEKENLESLNFFDFEGKEIIYKFKSDKIRELKIEINKKLCEYYKIATKLVDLLEKGTPLSNNDQDLIKYCHVLKTEVIDINIKKFKTDFIEENRKRSNELQYFRERFLDVLIERNLKFEDYQNKTFNIQKNFGRRPEQKWLVGRRYFGIKEKSLSDVKDLPKENLKKLSEIIINNMEEKKIFEDNSDVKYFDILLLKYVIDSKSKLFKQSFLDIGDATSIKDKGLEIFYNCIKNELKGKSINLKKINDYMLRENKKFEFSKYFGSEEFENQVPWPEILKHDNVINDIKCFFNIFHIATEQPDSGIIQEKMRTDFNNEHFFGDNIYNSFFNDAHLYFSGNHHNFCRSKVKKRFLSDEDFKLYFTENNRKVNDVFLRKRAIEYEKNAEKFNIHFNDSGINEKFRFFLKNENKILIISSEYTILSSIKLLRFIDNEKIDNKKMHENFIFIRSSDFLSSNYKNIVVKSFKTKLCIHSLLIIEIDSFENIKEVSNEIKALNVSAKKNIIVIVQKKHFTNIEKIFNNEECIEKYEDTKLCINDIDEAHQRKISENMCIQFQGKDTSLSEIIDDPKNLIDGKILTQLMHDEKIKIGQLYEEYENIHDYYMNRKLFFKIKIDNDILLIVGLEECDLLLAFGENVIEYSLRFDIDSENKFSEFENSIFEQECKRNKEKNIYLWKKKEDKIFLLKKIINSTLKQNEKKISKAINEAFKMNIVCLSSFPGVGKSSIFNHLCETIKKQYPLLWVYKIDLNRVSNEITILKKDLDHTGIFNFLLAALKIENDLEIKVFKYYFEKKKIVIFLDGIDEISKGDHEKLIEFINACTIYLKNIFISTRPQDHILKKISDISNIVLCDLYPFSKEDQEKFLIKFWKSNETFDADDNHKEHDDNHKEHDDFAKNILNDFNEKIIDGTEFLGVALNMMMIAEAYNVNLKKNQNSCKSDGRKKTTLNELQLLNLSEIYKRFMEIKFFDTYFSRKIKCDIRKFSIETVHAEFFENVLAIKMRRLALSSLFDEKQIKTLLSSENYENLEKDISSIKDGGENFGIIVNIIDFKPYFTHKTFAEFFVAEFFIKNINKDVDEKTSIFGFFLDEILSQETYSMVCIFIEDMIQNVTDDIKEQIKNKGFKLNGKILQFAFQKKWRNIVNYLIPITTIDIDYTNETKESVLHLAMKYDWTENINQDEKSCDKLEFFLNKLKKSPNDLKKMIGKKNNENCTPFISAASLKYWKNVIIFLEILGRFEDTNISDYIYDTDKSKNNILHLATTCDNETHIESILKLIETHGKKPILESLLKRENVNGFTPMETAAKFNKNENNLKFFIETCDRYNILDSLIYPENKRIFNILELTIENKSDKCFQYLVHELREKHKKLLISLVQNKNKDGHTPLLFSVKHNLTIVEKNVNTLKQLNLLNTEIGTKDNNDNNILHIAASNETKDILQFICTELANINGILEKLLDSTNKSGYIPIFNAVESNSLESVKYLLKLYEKIGSMSCAMKKRTNDKNNILHLAALNGNHKMIQLLFENIETSILSLLIKQKNIDRKTPLALALDKKNGSSVGIFMEKRENIDDFIDLDSEQNNILHLILRSEDDSICMNFMTQFGKTKILKNILEHTNSDENTPITYAIKYNSSCEIVNHLLIACKKEDIFIDIAQSKDKEKNNILNLAIINENEDILRILIQHLLNIDHKFLPNIFTNKNNNRKTPLISAIECNNLNIIKILFTSFDKFNKSEYIMQPVDDDDNNIFHILSKKEIKKNKNIVQYLINYITKFGKFEEIINSKNNLGRTPFHTAVKNNNVELVETFIKKFHELKMSEINITSTDSSGYNILHIAVEHENDEVLHCLLKEFENNTEIMKSLFDHPNNKGFKPLCFAINNNKKDYVRIFIDFLCKFNFLDILQNDTDKNFNNILHLTSSDHSNDILQIIYGRLNEYPNILNKLIKSKNENNFTPLDLTIDQGNANNAKIFIEMFEELKILDDLILAKDNNNNSIMHLAAKKDDTLIGILFDKFKNNENALKTLLQKQNKSHFSPLIWAMKDELVDKRVDNVKALIEIYKKINMFEDVIRKNDSGQNNIFHSALEYKSDEILDYLLTEIDHETLTILKNKNDTNDILLSYAIKSNYEYGTKALIKKMMETEISSTLQLYKDSDNNNIIHLAAKNDGKMLQTVIKELEGKKCIIHSLCSARNKFHEKPSDIASKSGCKENMEILIKLSDF